MSQAKITILAFDSFMESRGLDLFSELILPDGIDKDTLTKSILLDAADFELLYSNPLFMREAIGIWSKKHYRTFDRWIKALNIDYNPLENYDRMEDWTDITNELNSNMATSASNESSTDHINGENHNTANGSNITDGKVTVNGENKKSAFDSTTYQPSDKTDSTTSDDTTVTSSNSSDNTNSSDATGSKDLSSRTDTSGSRDINNIRSGRAHGNIGVTTSQQMLEAELNISKWNIYQQIVDLFINDFCIMIYV